MAADPGQSWSAALAALPALPDDAGAASSDEEGWAAALAGLLLEAPLPEADDSPPLAEHPGQAADLAFAIVPHTGQGGDIALAHGEPDSRIFSTQLDFMLAAAGGQAPEENPIFDVAKHFLGTHVNIQSMESLAHVLKCSPKDLRRGRQLAASISVLLERHAWRRVVHGLAAQHGHGVELLLYMEFHTYDGVDLPMKAQSSIVVDGLPEPGGVRSGTTDLAMPVSDIAVAAGDKGESTSGVMKLLNSETATMMLCRIHGKLTILTGSFLTLLHAVERNTAECLLAAAKTM